MNEKLLAEKNNLKEKNFKCIEDKMRIENILNFLEGKPDFENFDADLFRDIVHKVVIHDNENINFEFKGGFTLPL